MTNTQDMQAVVQRVERLERQNHRMRVATLSVVGCVGLSLLLGQAKQPTTDGGIAPVKASAFYLVDNDGKAIGRWTSEGISTMALGEGGGFSLAIGHGQKAGAQLALYDNKRTRVRLQAGKQVSVLRFLDDDGRDQLMVGTSPGGGTAPGPLIALIGDDWGLDLGASSLAFSSATEKTTRVLLGVADKSALILSDADGNMRAVLGSTLSVHRNTGEARTLPESSLLLLDKAGKTLFAAP